MSKKEEKDPLAELQKTLAEMKEDIGEVYSRLTTLEQTSLSHKEEGGEGKGSYCPDCGVMVKDVFAHLKKEPEKHGLVKTVEKEVVKEVAQKKALSDRLAEHDFFDCPECRKVIDEHLDKKGLKIAAKEKEEEGFVLEI